MRIRNLSASQFADHQLCRRYWYNRSVLGKRSPPTPGQALGTSIHSGAEARIKTGAYDTVSESVRPFARSLEKFYPSPGEPGVLVEAKMSLPTILGVPWIGLIDLMRQHAKPFPTIIDWKSSSNIQKYSKAPIDLLTDMQPMSYARWAYEVLGIRGMVRVGLVYVATKVPKTMLPPIKPVFIDVDRAHVTRTWDSAKPRLEMMARDSEAACAQDVEPNTASCGAYGGCPFRSECGITSPQFPAGFFPHKQERENVPMSSFLERLKANKAANGGGAVQQAAVPPVTQHVAPAQPPQGQEVYSAPAPGQVVPPDAPPRDVAVAEAPKARRPRRTKAEMEAARAAEATPDLLEPQAAPRAAQAPEYEPDLQHQAVAAAARRPVQATQRKEFVLYIDCYPTKAVGGVEPTMIDDWFGPIEMDLNEAAVAEKNVPHYMLLDFGTQKGYLALRVQEQIGKGLPPAMIVKSGTNAAREVLQYLIPHATLIVQGSR